MSESDPWAISRRALLRGAAVTGAAALVDPGGALGRPGSGGALARAPGARPVFSRWVGMLAGGASTPPIAAPRRFSLVGVEWRAPDQPRIELRTRSLGDGGWTRWMSASVLGHDPDGNPGAGASRFGEPVWVGAADDVQLRSAGPVEGVRLHFVAADVSTPAPGGLAGASAAATFPLAHPVLAAGPGQPPIIARAAWAHGHARPAQGPEYGTVKLAFVHHSETGNGYSPGQVPSILNSIFVFHRFVRDYFDIGYNFAIDAFGRIWEARAGGIDQAVIGAHAGGYNALSTGVVVLGNYMDAVPSTAAIGALERLLAWKLALHGVPALGRVTVTVDPAGASYTPFRPDARVSLPRVAGHRDGDSTSCPGDAFYARLPSIRPRVAQLAGAPARLTIAAPVAPVPPVGPGTTVTISGRLTNVKGGAALPGAPVELQRVTGRDVETPFAELTTDSAGGWSYTFAATRNMLLRALHRPAPAAVSDVVVISVAPTLTLALTSSSPLRVTGTVSPALPSVTVDLYRVVRGRRKLVGSKRVPAASGQFAAGFGTRAGGRYVVIARTPASAAYVAGASPALAVTIA